MTFTSPLKKYSLRAILLLPLLIGMVAVPAAAQTKPAPASAATLEVCHDTVTGNWRYSGVVAVAGSGVNAYSLINMEHQIENKTSATGYLPALNAPSLDAVTLPSVTGSRIARYSVDGPALSLGTLRNTSNIRISDPFAPSSVPVSLAASFEVAAAVCGCPKPTGCVRTQGYWKSKPGVVWPAPYTRDAAFFSSGLTWQQILETPPAGGNGYIILAHQYIAAVLNRASGASAPSALQTVIANAATYFASGATPASCGGSLCEQQKTWAGILDTYNNGQYPGAPGHCPD